MKKKILIVDDDVRLSQLSCRILEKGGDYDIMVVNESLQAFSSAARFQPDLVLLDVDMPGKDGGEIAGELNENPNLRKVPIIFLTGLVSNAETGRRKSEIGGKSYLAKPVEPQVLLDAVAQTLGAQPRL